MKKRIPSLLVLFVLVTGCRANGDNAINNGLDASAVIRTLNKGKALFIRDRIITGDLDFTEVTTKDAFSSSLLLAEVDVPVTFFNCIFMGKVTTNGHEGKNTVITRFGDILTFEACDFRSDADFSNCYVEGDVNFTGAVFREKALFNNITFSGRQTYFTAFSSEKYFSMQESSIRGNIDFFKGTITGKLTFQSTEFGGIARFSDLDCDGKTDFSLCTFRNNALFNYANFGNDFRMAGAVIEGKSDLISVSFQSDAWFNNSVFHGMADLTKTQVKGTMDLGGTTFYAGKPVMDDFKTGQDGALLFKESRVAVFNAFEPFH